jgi:hypothetical protein
MQNVFLAASIIACLAWLGMRLKENKARRERQARNLKTRLGMAEIEVK